MGVCASRSTAQEPPQHAKPASWGGASRSAAAVSPSPTATGAGGSPAPAAGSPASSQHAALDQAVQQLNDKPPRRLQDRAPTARGLIEAPDEAGRLRAVQALALVGVAPKPQLESVTTLMKHMFGTAVSAITLIQEELQFVARSGDWACSATRAGSFCDSILVPDTHEMLIVEDATRDPRFRDNPFVSGAPFIKFYAGAPLVASNDGHRYGTLCVFDFKPRSFAPSQYALLAHFAELVVREMEREQALCVQRAELELARKAKGHLLRAMDAFHEGIALLDLSPSAWDIVYVNTAFREAAHMPRLLLGGGSSSGGGGGGGGSSAARGSAPAAPADFWRLFQHVTSGDRESYKAALQAMAAGRDFTIQVAAVPSSHAAVVGGLGTDAGRSAQPVLTVLFRPADAQALRGGMPHIGIPMLGGAQEGEEGAPARSSSDVAAASPFAALAQQPRPSVDGGASSSSHYYFGIVQNEQQQRQQQQQRRQQRLPAAAAAGVECASPLTLGSPGGRGATPSPTPSGCSIEQQGGIRHCPSAEQLQLGAAAQVPSFLQMRPEVLHEVKLGPLIGSGSMGRCYRGNWQGGRVAVKIVDCYDACAEAPRSGSGGKGGLGLSPLDEETGKPGTQAAVVEAVLARSLTHPHIVTTFTHAVSVEQLDGGRRTHTQVWIVQELCSRGSLLDAIDRGLLQHSSSSGGESGSPNLPAILATATEIAGAMTYLHSNGVIHGDLTPSNVLLASSLKDARRWVAKVGDFGLSHIISPPENKGSSDAGGGGASAAAPEQRPANLGTVTHMPPELLASGALSQASDVFSFGVMLLEMWYSQRAWLGVPPTAVYARATVGDRAFDLPTDAPPPLASLMERCTCPDPAQRPPFAQVLEQLQDLLQRHLAAAAAERELSSQSLPSVAAIAS